MAGASRNILLVLGPPGAGKTTQGARLAEALGGLHVSAGELVRAARAAGEVVPKEPGRRGGGALASLDWTVQRIEEACQGHMLAVIDGFPRVPEHVGAAHALGRIRGAIHLGITLDQAIDRMRGREREGEDIAWIVHRWNIYRKRETGLREALAAAGLPVMDVDGHGEPVAVAARVRAAANQM